MLPVELALLGIWALRQAMHIMLGFAIGLALLAFGFIIFILVGGW